MLGFSFALGSSLLLNWVSVCVVLGFLLPLSMMYMYKTHSYLENEYFYNGTLPGVLSFLVLSLLLLILLASSESDDTYFTFLQVLLAMLLLNCFSINNLLGFYILFEACLIPILIMIISWGYQPERLQAGMYMVLYTVVLSMPLLVIIFRYYWVMGTFNLHSLALFNFLTGYSLLLGFMAFLVKLPVYGLHIWLPKAHVEAPLGGSMVLAGVLLKLGGYGLNLYNSLINTVAINSLVYIISVSVWGGVLAAIACLTQNDIKAFIAYSSIVHMSVVVMGVLSNTSWGLVAATITMVAHGWVSSALFFLSFLTYKISGSRSFSYTKGMLVLFPVISLMWFIFSMFNMGVPPTINFIGELFIVPVSLFFSWQMFMPMAIIMFLSVLYNMYLYCQINHGAVTNYQISAKTLNSRCMLTLVGHIMPMVFLFNMTLLTN